jgi:hypothetical protein
MASFCVFFFYTEAHRETEAHFTAAGMSSQTNNSEALRFKRAAFYNGLKSKVGLAAVKAAALRVNLNVQGCGIVAAPMHAPPRTPLLLPLLLSHNLPNPPRPLVRDEQTHPHRPRLVVSHSTCPPLSSPPHANSFVIGPVVIKHTHQMHQRLANMHCGGRGKLRLIQCIPRTVRNDANLTTFLTGQSLQGQSSPRMLCLECSVCLDE